MKLVSVAEAAEFFGVNEYTMRRLCNEGKVECHKIGRLLRVNIEETLEKTKQHGVENTDKTEKEDTATC